MRTSEPDIGVRLYADATPSCFYLAEPVGAMRAAAKIDVLLDTSTEPGTSYLGAMASGMALILNGAGQTGIDKLREAANGLASSDGSTPRRRTSKRSSWPVRPG